jgi:hypothetical protein
MAKVGLACTWAYQLQVAVFVGSRSLNQHLGKKKVTEKMADDLRSR